MVGKLLTTNSYNVRAFKTTMANVWKAKGELEIKDVDRNLFTYRFLK